MPKTLTGTYSGPVQVQFSGNNPLSVAATISVSSYTALALQPGTGTNWTVNNSGRIVADGIAFGGLVFGSNLTAVTSGTLTNGAGGYIYGHTVGVMVYGANGVVTNLAGATISGGRYGINASGALTVSNAGSLHSNTLDAVRGGSDASVTNLTGGRIDSGATGVRLRGSQSTLSNQTGATITATGTAVVQYYGTLFNAGQISGYAGIWERNGSITNQTGGQIVGGRYGIAASSASIVNQANATISATSPGNGPPSYGNAGRGIVASGTSTVINSGLVEAVKGFAVDQTAGVLSNASSGTITSRVAIRLGSGTFINAGTVSASSTAFQFNSNTASNRLVMLPSAVFSGGVSGGGGVLELASSSGTGTISGLGSSFTSFSTLQVDAGASWALSGANTVAYGVSLLNSGTITGALTLAGHNTLETYGTLTGSGGTAATFLGTASNAVLLHPGAVISGQVSGSSSASNLLRLMSGGTGSLYSFQNTFTGFNRLQVDVGAQWTLSGTLEAGMAVANYGSLFAYLNAGIGGLITNASGATLASSAPTMIFDGTSAATVVNAGRIAADGFSIFMTKGGSVTNTSSGSITGRGIDLNGTAGTILNSGIIQSFAQATSDGIALRAGGIVTNTAGATISGNRYGINLTAGGTVHDGGFVSGGSGTAVVFGGVGSNLLILDPGATISGVVVGSASASNQLELASAVSSGTLSGVNSNFANFSLIDVDSGATWRLDSSTIASGMTLNDAGTVTGAGVTLGDGGQLSIAVGGAITASGVSGVSGVQTIVNAGSILPASGGTGVYLSGGSVTNLSGGYITGLPIRFHIGAGTVVNSGAVIGNGGPGLSADGILLAAGGTVTNTNGGTITGQRFGILLSTGGTVTNAGTISGVNGAVFFGGTASSRLIVDPGAVFSGSAMFNAGADATLELAGTSSGSLSGLGSDFAGFDTLQIDSGAQWTLSGSNTLAAGQSIINAGSLTLLDTSLNNAAILQNDGVIHLDPSTMTIAGLTGTGSVTVDDGSTLEVGGTVATGETIRLTGTNASFVLDAPTAMAGSVVNFGDGDVIHLEGVDPNSVSFSGGLLHFGSGNSFALSLANTGPVQALSDGAGGANVSLLCFCAGTRIATPTGEVAVQRLAVGDLVLTLSGAARPVRWIGEGRVMATRGRRNAATPVIVRKGALAPNVPNRDLRITKGHALYFDGALIPVEELVNHRSILWDDRAQEVAIYHVELDTHDVLLANGAPAESYRDDGNRWLFSNASSRSDLSPEEPCAPILSGGALVDAVWRRLLERSGLRPGVPLTDDPDTHLLVDGKRVDAISNQNGVLRFNLRPQPSNVHIMSRCGIPAELGLSRDHRPLGVALVQIVLRQKTCERVIDAMHHCFADAWHPFEPENGFRWTNGDSALPQSFVADMADGVELELHVGCTARYPLFADVEDIGPA